MIRDAKYAAKTARIGKIEPLVAMALSPDGVYIEKSTLLDLTRRVHIVNGGVLLNESDFEICLHDMEERDYVGVVESNGTQWVYLAGMGRAHYPYPERTRENFRVELKNRALEHLRNYCNNI